MESMRQVIRELTKPENIVKTYKEMYVGISDDEAQRLAEAFTATITTGKDRHDNFKRLLAAAKRKYGERDLTPVFEYDFPELDF